MTEEQAERVIALLSDVSSRLLAIERLLDELAQPERERGGGAA